MGEEEEKKKGRIKLIDGVNVILIKLPSFDNVIEVVIWHQWFRNGHKGATLSTFPLM